MCGISCILSLASQAQHQQQQPRNGERKTAVANERERLDKELNASLAKIAHRGPDNCNNWISDDCRVGTLAYHTYYLSQ